MHSYPITDAALRWLDLILAEHFGHAWHLVRVDDSLHLSLESANGAIVFDLLQAGITEAHNYRMINLIRTLK